MRTLLLALPLALPATLAAQERPNVVLIISDDQAWNDFGFMGSDVVRTPNLDRLAKEGALFPRGYVPTALCRPSLATLATGLYPHQHRITGNDPPAGVDRASMLEHIDAVDTLPALLAEAGYRSLQTGKWWEGSFERGGFTEGMTHGDTARGGRHGDEGLRIGREGLEPITSFVDECRAESTPFFVWYAPFLPHTPHDPPARLLEQYTEEGRSEHVAKYYAMCEWFDETCGALLQHLDEDGAADDTLVILITDNGWIQNPKGRGFAARSKRSPYEGGVRTPIVVRWPGRVEPEVCTELASGIDVVPTVLAACGVDVPAGLPGVDLRALARGEVTRQSVFGAAFTHDVVDLLVPAESALFRWVIEGRWKLVHPVDRTAPTELFDLAFDPHETKNVAAESPGVVTQLLEELDRWWPVDVVEDR